MSESVKTQSDDFLIYYIVTIKIISVNGENVKLKFTIYNAQFTIHNSQCTMHNLQCTIISDRRQACRGRVALPVTFNE